ncbi:MAG: monofunctional biosynthetic peptidoglycan transglycosylase [Candidatus Azobacteroides sp.]|nr:monofunctional biosynthetic peptidoglycan transglycosylase [Candidatus Azobacteroides sp.]
MKKTVQHIVRGIRNLFLLLFSLSLFFVILYKYIPIYYTPYMFAKNVEQWRNKEKIHFDHQWKSLPDISPYMAQAVIASEDYLFLIHNGFDSDNLNMNLNRGARILYLNNATISQRTARNVFLFPGKNYVNNTLETYFTILIEFVWGKKRILEVYLNSVEMGNAVFGAEAIAQKSFHVPAKDLNISEAALVAACLINPSELNPSEPTTYLLRRQAKIMGIMEEMIDIKWRFE